MKGLIPGLLAILILAAAALPSQADQTFWTIDTGRLPTPAPTAPGYPIELQYLYNPTPSPFHCGRHNRNCTCRVGYWFCPAPGRNSIIPRPSEPRRLPMAVPRVPPTP